MAFPKEREKKPQMLFIRNWIKFQNVTSYRYNLKTGLRSEPVTFSSREGRASKWPALTSESTTLKDPLFVTSELI
jgi:hypothetical protein